MTKAPRPSVRLKVKVVPGSSRDQFVGWLGDAAKIKVTAPPEKGRANEAVVSLLCERLGLPADAVSVASGHSSPPKVIIITGMDEDAIKKALKQDGRCGRGSGGGEAGPDRRTAQDATGRAGRTDVSDLKVSVNALPPVSEPLYAVA